MATVEAKTAFVGTEELVTGMDATATFAGAKAVSFAGFVIGLISHVRVTAGWHAAWCRREKLTENRFAKRLSRVAVFRKVIHPSRRRRGRRTIHAGGLRV